MSPDIDQSCVFPSADRFGLHHSCRRIEDWEETGIDSNFRVRLYNYQLRVNSLNFSLSAPLKLMIWDLQSHIDGVGVVKVVH